MNKEENIKQPTDNILQLPENETVPEPLTINDQPSTIMEVHKHPHHVTHKKKWGEYLLEFFMLFLAVFLGFVAENIREHISERENEKVYMQSLVQNIKNDISTIKDQQKVFDQRVILLDSLISILDAPTITSNTGNLYYYARMATKDNGFFGNSSTFDQMKSTGGLKLIKSKSVTESILSYYTIIDEVRQLQFVGEEGELNEYRKIAVQIFNADVFNQINSISMNMVARPVDNPPLRTTDRKLLGDLAGWAHYIKNTRIGIDQFKKGVFEKGEKLIKQIEKEYHLEIE
ncbi:MAG: hypothetical protein ABIT07_13155 [Ferruginibacter sp.]